MTAEVKRVALYARVSTDDKGQNVDAQLVPLRAFALRRGWEIVADVSDHASADDLRRRVAWRELLRQAAQHDFDLILVWKLDRAFRNAGLALSTVRRLDHWGVGFASMTEADFDTTSPVGHLVFTILAAVAEMEKANIAERVKAGMERARAKGVRLGRPSKTATPAFRKRWATVKPEVVAGRVSRRAAATKLRVGQTTIRRLLAEDVAA